MCRYIQKKARWVLLFLGVLACAPARAHTVDLTALSLEELMGVEVTTVSKKEQRLFESPAAVYVIGREDIRRSGATSIPEALRLAPGVQVGSVDANKWAVSVRGFTGLFANKLLVLIDGRSIYTPLFSGVFWEAQDVLLEDVEQIEVIRGPGGTLWGANAVNGIINVITRKAGETQGGMVKAGGGTEERGFGSVRYGGRLGEGAFFRIYGKAFVRDASEGVTVADRRDGWHAFRAGGRVDREAGAHTLSLLGDIYAGEVGQFVSMATSPASLRTERVHSDAKIDGGHLLGRWEARLGDRSDLAFQAYFDRAARDEAALKGTIYNADLDFQHRVAPVRRLEVVWGWGYRLTRDRMEGDFPISFAPDRRSTHLFSGFVHQEFSLAPDRLRLMLGSKFERNTYTGFEAQPNARFWWAPAPGHALWGAFARPVRTPSRSEQDIRATFQVLPPDSLFAGAPPAQMVLLGDRGFESERVRSFDAGYRARFGSRFSMDLAGFYNRYDNLRTNEPDLQEVEVVADPLHLVIPVRVDNRAGGKSCGVEATADVQVNGAWRLHASYSYLRMELKVDEGSRDSLEETFVGENAKHQVRVRSYADLSDRLALNLAARYVHRLPAQNLPGYFTLDAHLRWRLGGRTAFSLVGRNLLDSPRTEFISSASGTLPSRVQAGVYGAISRTF